jgi:hypothetical protein
MSASGRIDVAKKSVQDARKLQGGRISKTHMLLHRCPPAARGTLFRAAARLVLALLPMTVLLAAGCGKPKAASAMQSPEVEVATVVEKG